MRAPRLLMVAHGTASAAGTAATRSLADSVAAVLPDVAVELCFLDVATPRLADALTDEPTVLVPLLLSTGYHVQTDIPALVSSRPATIVTAHLGPDPLVLDALAHRLVAAEPDPDAEVFLVAAGSTRPGARDELETAAAWLGQRLATDVQVLTMSVDLRAEFRALDTPVAVATYLLAEGRFVDDIRAAVAGFGVAGAPLGAHPSLVELVRQRYDAAVQRGRVQLPGSSPDAAR